MQEMQTKHPKALKMSTNKLLFSCLKNFNRIVAMYGTYKKERALLA